VPTSACEVFKWDPAVEHGEGPALQGAIALDAGRCRWLARHYTLTPVPHEIAVHIVGPQLVAPLVERASLRPLSAALEKLKVRPPDAMAHQASASTGAYICGDQGSLFLVTRLAYDSQRLRPQAGAP